MVIFKDPILYLFLNKLRSPHIHPYNNSLKDQRIVSSKVFIQYHAFAALVLALHQMCCFSVCSF